MKFPVVTGDCKKTYIGRTNRRIKARLDKHRQSVNKGNPNSALYVATSNHKIGFDKTRYLAQLNFSSKAIEIEINKN